jgi:hypothetical protein
MIKSLKYYFVCFTLLLTLAVPQNAAADMDPRAKALGAMALYGTVGGALLGTASLAFGTKGRSVAIGASLGLYAGLIFGTYVIASHQMKKNGYYDQSTPYYPDSGNTPYGTGGGDSGAYDDGGYYNLWNPYDMPEMKVDTDRMNRGLKLSPDFNKAEGPVYYLQLLKFQF